MHLVSQLTSNIQERGTKVGRTAGKMRSLIRRQLHGEFSNARNTVKPPNKGHIGDGPVVPCREVILFSEVFFYLL